MAGRPYISTDIAGEDLRQKAENAAELLKITGEPGGLAWAYDMVRATPEFLEEFKNSPLFNTQVKLGGNNPWDSEKLEAMGAWNAELVTLYETFITGLLEKTIWAQWGFNVFDLSPDLTAALLLTEPAKVCDEPKLPFPSFMIRIPPGFFKLGKVSGVYEERDVRLISVTRFGQYNGDPAIQWRVSSDQTSLSSTKRVENLDEDLEDNDAIGTITSYQSANVALRLIRNLSSWLESKGGVSKVGSKMPRSRKKAHKARAAIWNIGAEVKLPKQLIAQAQEVAVGKARRPKGWEVRVKHVVRGHWKMQTHGPGGAERKRLWVMPYWRGPDEAEAWSHIYKVGP